MTPFFAAAVGGLSPLELFELFAAGCFASAVASWAGTAWWMKRRWEAEVAAEWADGMAADEPDPEPLAPVYRLPARYQHGRPDLAAGLHQNRRVD